MRSSAAFAQHQASISRWSASGNAGCSYSAFWKPVARWISAVSTAGKRWNSSSGSVDAPCWTAPASPYSRATSPSSPEDLEVELDLGHAAVRQRHAAVRRAGLDADLGDPDGARGARLELAAVPVEVRPQLLDRRVLLADLADLAADADRHAVGLERPDEGGQLGRAAVVLALLLVDGSACDRSTRVELSMSMLR